MNTVHTDVAVVGGSFAGLSAALQLSRGRRRVTLFDTGMTRNRYAKAAHGFLGQDGQTPDTIRLRGRAEVMTYPTARLVTDPVRTISVADTGFTLQTDRGDSIDATLVILAHGMTDILPDIPGLATLWGQTALQCPYCHGFENADLPTAVLMHPATLPHARFLTEWTKDILMLTHGQALDQSTREKLISDGYTVIDSSIAAFIGTGGQLTGVQFSDGRMMPRSILYLTPQSRLSTDLSLQLGCHLTQGPFGSYITVDAQQRTSVTGLFAAGDITRPFYGSVFAAADGVRAAVACHQSLVWGPEFLDRH